MQYQDASWIGIFITLFLSVFILWNIWRAQKGIELSIRKIPGLNALDDAVGRATEMGKPVLMVPGLGPIGTIVIQSLNVFAFVTKMAAKLATPIRICCSDASVYTLAQEIIGDVYRAEGLGSQYDTDSVRFISDRQFAFAAGVAGIVYREQVAATILFGDFFAESLIIAEAANGIGAIQIAASTQNTQTPFFIAACDYVLIADEFYAASAYLTKAPTVTGSLVGQDWCKIFIIVLTILGVIVNSVFNNLAIWENGNKTRQELPLYELLTPKSKAIDGEM